MEGKSVIKILSMLLVALLASAGVALADGEWTTSGNNIYNTNTGNIGIGTASPTKRLSVAGQIQAANSSDYNRIEVIGTSADYNNNGFRLIDNGHHFNMSIDSLGNYLINEYTGSTWLNRFTIQNGGNIGIGTMIPYAKFHVKQGSADIVGVRISRTQADGNPMLQFSDDVTYNNNIQLVAGTYNLAIAPDFGNIGIGTTAPLGKLHVKGAGESFIWGSGTTTYPTTPKPGAGNLIGKASNSDYRIALQDGNGRVNHYWNAYSDTEGYKYITSEAAVRLLMSTNGVAGGLVAFYGAPSGTAGAAITWVETGCLSSNDKVWFSPRGAPSDLYLNSSGYIGIGTTNPQSILSVNGTITTKKVKVTETGWSDFVFDAGYKLPTLAAVESHIKQYKHLPGIPSAREVKQKGLDVSDVLAKQMQKIEELTLYMIEMQKKNEEIQKENQDLKKRINTLEKQISQN